MNPQDAHAPGRSRCACHEGLRDERVGAPAPSQATEELHRLQVVHQLLASDVSHIYIHTHKNKIYITIYTQTHIYIYVLLYV